MSSKRFACLCFRADNLLVTYEDELFPLVVGEASIILRDIPDEFSSAGCGASNHWLSDRCAL